MQLFYAVAKITYNCSLIQICIIIAKGVDDDTEDVAEYVVYLLCWFCISNYCVYIYNVIHIMPFIFIPSVHVHSLIMYFLPCHYLAISLCCPSDMTECVWETIIDINV